MRDVGGQTIVVGDWLFRHVEIFQLWRGNVFHRRISSELSAVKHLDICVVKTVRLCFLFRNR